MFDFKSTSFELYFGLKPISDYSDLSMPDSQLCQPRKTWTTKRRDYDSLKILSYISHNSDISIYGVNNVQIHQFRYARVS